MQFSTAAFLAVMGATTVAAGCTFTAFSDWGCKGDVGVEGRVPEGGRCFLAEGRHSIEIKGDGCEEVFVQFFSEETNCGGKGGLEAFRHTPGCHDVRTGEHWKSAFVRADKP